MLLDGKIAVITGVTSGVGAALAERLLGAGATVAGIARDPDKLAARAAKWGARFAPFAADLADSEATRRAADEIARTLDRVDLLVNNAAECVYEAPLELAMDAWRRLIEVNFLSVIEITKRLAPRMAAGGHLVNVSSVTARFLPNERFAPYALTKSALEHWHAAIRLELEPRRIKSTLIVPGLIDTPIYDKVTGFERARGKLKEQLPQWLTAGDVADAIVWAIGRPEHVVVGEMTLLPLGQAR